MIQKQMKTKVILWMAPLFAAHPFSYADFLHKYIYLTKHILADMTILPWNTLKNKLAAFVFSSDVGHPVFNAV